MTTRTNIGCIPICVVCEDVSRVYWRRESHFLRNASSRPLRPSLFQTPDIIADLTLFRRPSPSTLPFSEPVLSTSLEHILSTRPPPRRQRGIMPSAPSFPPRPTFTLSALSYLPLVALSCLLSLPVPTRAFTFAFNDTNAATCDMVEVSWRGGSPPFHLLIIVSPHI
jgi:hypothetical protein